MTPRYATRTPTRGGTSFQRARAGDSDLPVVEQAFWDYTRLVLPESDVDPLELLEQDQQNALQEYRVLSKATSGGGFLVPTDVGEAITAAARAAGAVAQVAQEITTETGDTIGVALAGTHGSAAWVAESGSYTASDETITQQNMGAFKGATKIIVSEELLTDEAVRLDSYLAQELGGRIGGLQEAAFCVGDGSGKPLGIVNASSPYAVSTAPTGSSLLFKPADVLQFYKALPAAYRLQGSWIIHADDFASLAASADTAGGLVFPSLQFDPPSLYGRPVYVSADLPAPAANAKSLAFGNWQLAYGIRRVARVGVARQEELHADSGQVGFKLFARVDGRPLLSAAAIIGQHSAT